MKRAFILFILVISLLVGSILTYLQSTSFARLTKNFIAQRLPSNLGIEGDFSELALKLFPPGVSIVKPTLKVSGKNPLNLPTGASIDALRIDLTFRPFQMFSGNIRIHNVIILDGNIFLPLDQAKKEPPKKAPKTLGVQWDELFQIHAEGVTLENTRLKLQVDTPQINAQVLAKYFRLAQWAGKTGLGYELELDLSEIQGHLPKEWSLPPQIDQLRGHLRLNALGSQIEELTLRTAASELKVRGTIQGNLLHPNTLLADFKIEAQGDLQRTTSPWLSQKAPQGEYRFHGKLQANLERFLQTLHSSGELLIKKPCYQQWTADELTLKVQLKSNDQGHTLKVESGLLKAEERPRIGGKQPGHGGSVEILPFQTQFKPQFSLKGPLQVPLHFHRAHLHWLAAPGVRDVFALDFRISGPLNIRFETSQDPSNDPWKIQTQLQLTLDEFSLDNQRLNIKKPLQQVLHIPQIQLHGDLEINSQALEPGLLYISLPHTKFKVEGNLDFKKGYNLYARGPVNLADIGEIAESKIRGEGTLSTHLHGLSSRALVDFDVQLKNGFYLNLNLGDLSGRITWDDDPENLIFSKMNLQQGQTNYTGGGVINFSKQSSIQMDLSFSQGNTQDLIKIFNEFTHDLWWFPASLSGPLKGTVQIRGTPQMRGLKALGQFTGSNWDYFGERFKSVQVTGGYDSGTYFLQELKATKVNGGFNGRISYTKNQEFDWEFKTDNLSITDLDHLARLNVPVRGKIQASSRGKSVAGALTSDTRLSISNFSVRGTPMPPSLLSVRSEGGVLLISGTAFGGQGELDLIYDFKPGNKSSVRVETKKLDVNPLLLLLNPKLSQDPSLLTSLTGTLQVNFLTGKSELGSGLLDLSEFSINKSNTYFQLNSPQQIVIQNGNFQVQPLSFISPESHLSLSLDGKSAKLNGKLEGQVDLSLLEFILSPIASSSGPLRVDLDIAGSLKEPLISGTFNLKKDQIRIHSLESPFENISGSIALKQNLIRAEEIRSEFAGGTVLAEGTAQLFTDRLPLLNLLGTLNENRIKFFPFQYAKTNGKINITGDTLPYSVGGSLEIESALSKEKVMQQKQGEGLRATQYLPPPTSVTDNTYPLFRLNLDVKADRGIFIQNDLFDAELKCRLKVVNTLETPRILGTAHLIQGKMIFKNRVFQIQSANATFDSPTVINPSFDLSANTEVNNNKIHLYASGRLEKWKIELTSNPVMSESEILSILAMGISSAESKKMSTSDRSVIEQGEAASLLLHSLDFNREVENKTGFQIQLGEATDPQSGTSVVRPQSTAESITSPKIIIKTQIGKDLDISYGSTVGIGTSNRKEVNAEYKVTPNFSVIGVWDNYESTDAQDKKSYGMDLKWQKRFK